MTISTEVLKVNRNFVSLSNCQKMVFLFSNQDVFRIVAKTCNFIFKKTQIFFYLCINIFITRMYLLIY